MSDESNVAEKIESPSSSSTPLDLLDARVRRLKTPKDCVIFMKNVSERGRPDLAQQARRWAIFLRTEQNEPQSELERAWLEALHAQEDVIAHRDRKPIRANP